MLFLISPAKSLDYSETAVEQSTLPRMRKNTQELVEVMKKKSAGELKELMKISDNLATLNAERYRNFSSRYTAKNSKQAVLTFNGEVYQGLGANDFTEEDFEYAQQHLRILSGLYGLLKPLDKIQPYRLEMGTKLTTEKGHNLYHYWDNQITDLVNKDLKKSGTKAVINLASNEYFKSVQQKNLKGELYHLHFKEDKNGEYKMISFFAKKARGLMCRFAIKHKITQPEDLKGFDLEGYAFNEALSQERDWVFTR